MSKELEQALETEQYENMDYVDTADYFKEYDISGVSDEYLDYICREILRVRVGSESSLYLCL